MSLLDTDDIGILSGQPLKETLARGGTYAVGVTGDDLCHDARKMKGIEKEGAGTMTGAGYGVSVWRLELVNS